MSTRQISKARTFSLPSRLWRTRWTLYAQNKSSLAAQSRLGRETLFHTNKQAATDPRNVQAGLYSHSFVLLKVLSKQAAARTTETNSVRWGRQQVWRIGLHSCWAQPLGILLHELRCNFLSHWRQGAGATAKTTLLASKVQNSVFYMMWKIQKQGVVGGGVRTCCQNLCSKWDFRTITQSDDLQAIMNPLKNI